MCYEKELKKAYKDSEKKNIHVILERLDLNLLNFLRHQCRDFCEVSKLDGVFRIYRIPKTNTIESEDTKKANKKKGKKNAAPKLK